MTKPLATPLLPSPPRRVLIVAPAPAQLLDLAGPAEVFSQASRLYEDGTQDVALYSVEVVVVPAGTTTPATSAGVSVAGGRSLAELVADRRPLDTLIVAGGEGARLHGAAPDLVDAVRRLAGRSRRTVSVCTGAFVLAAAGLLDGKRAATHWRWCDALARAFPRVRVEAEPIFVRDGDTWTSAGVTAGMDLALALVEADHGHALALAVARELVMFLRRPGGQQQFSSALSAQVSQSTGFRGTGLRDLIVWMADNLHRPLTVDMLAAHACMSQRHFARAFSSTFGVSPGRMLDRMRVDAARRRLEDAPHGLAAVAAACGFGAEETMRRAFLRHVGTSPGAYRLRFQRPEPETALH